MAMMSILITTTYAGLYIVRWLQTFLFWPVDREERMVFVFHNTNANTSLVEKKWCICPVNVQIFLMRCHGDKQLPIILTHTIVWSFGLARKCGSNIMVEDNVLLIVGSLHPSQAIRDRWLTSYYIVRTWLWISCTRLNLHDSNFRTLHQYDIIDLYAQRSQ